MMESCNSVCVHTIQNCSSCFCAGIHDVLLPNLADAHGHLLCWNIRPHPSWEGILGEKQKHAYIIRDVFACRRDAGFRWRLLLFLFGLCALRFRFFRDAKFFFVIINNTPPRPEHGEPSAKRERLLFADDKANPLLCCTAVRSSSSSSSASRAVYSSSSLAMARLLLGSGALPGTAAGESLFWLSTEVTPDGVCRIISGGCCLEEQTAKQK